MKTSILSALLLVLIVSASSEAADNIFLLDYKLASLDVIYASQDVYMRSGVDSLDGIIKKLQVVQNAWPEKKKTNAEPCYMLLRNETVRMINIKDGLGSKPINSKDYKYDCRESINYSYDKKRTQKLWQSI